MLSTEEEIDTDDAERESLSRCRGSNNYGAVSPRSAISSPSSTASTTSSLLDNPINRLSAKHGTPFAALSMKLKAGLSQAGKIIAVLMREEIVVLLSIAFFIFFGGMVLEVRTTFKLQLAFL